MLQFYTFTGESSASEDAARAARDKANHFLAEKDKIGGPVVVTTMLQSESQCVSVWDGQNDWSYSFTLTLVCNILENDVEKLWQLYQSSSASH